jgi:DNA-binding NarL/FixJ family response regulator
MPATTTSPSVPPRARKRNGRPPYEPTPEQTAVVETMASFGIPQDRIAQSLGINAQTLRKHFRQQLNLAAVHADRAVLSSLFEMATKRHNVAAAIFWAKTRCGFRPGCAP